MNENIERRIDDLLCRRKDPACLRIGIAGGSGSGKSTICGLIRERLLPCVTEVVSLDKFFKPVDQLPKYYSSRNQDYRPNFNSPDSFMIESMLAHCREVTASVVIFDGHFALHYPEMRELMDIKCFVSVDLPEMLDRRTARNLAAGYGGDLENILTYNQECVMPGYERFIQPTQAFADLLIPNNRHDTRDRDVLIGTLCQKIRSQHAFPGEIGV